MPNLTLYGTPISTYVRTVRLLLEEANADYELKDIGIFNGDNKTEDYLSKNPFGKIPTLEADGKIIYEDDAITHYLNETVADGKFSPQAPLQQARMYQIMSIVSSYLYGPAVGTIVIQVLVMPQQGKETDQEAVEKAVAPTQKALKAIEDLCQGDPYLLGDTLTIADFYLIPIFVYLAQTPQYKAATADIPKLKSWWKAVRSLDSFKTVCQ